MNDVVRKSLMNGLLAAGLLAGGVTASQADDSGMPPYGYGPGYGMGPGMMGMGPGMMGGYGMGPGMMGMGPGMMMGGWGMGHAFAQLNLTDEQRARINKIVDAEQRRHWEVAGKMMEQHTKLRDLYAAETPDPKKVGAVYAEMSKLHQQMIETHLQSFNEMQTVLTKEQREQLQQWRRGGWGPGARGMPGPGGMGPGMMGR